MVRIGLIGCGNIGLRHLQGLLKSSLAMEIHCFDPFEEALQKVKNTIANEIQAHTSVHFHTDINAFPDNFFAVILATDSKNRFQALNNFCEKHKAEHYILEKFLFNSVDEYAKTNNLLAHAKTVHVNCPRRLFATYQKLRGKNFTSISVEGNSWGMCSNSIHFIDVFGFIMNEIPFEYEFESGFKIVPSKRNGYIETYGNLNYQYKNCKVKINCGDGAFNGIKIRFSNTEEEFELIEHQGKIQLFLKGQFISEENIPFQSQLSHHYIENLYNNKEVGLTEYKLSADYHIGFLNGLNNAFDQLHYNGIRLIS